MRINALLMYVWLPLSLLAMVFGVYGCNQYNRVAGTDLTRPEIAFIAVSMNTGPFVGPLQGRNAFNDCYGRLIPIAVGALLVAWVSTLLVRRPLHRAWRFMFVLLHVAVGVLWYLAAAASLAYHLS